MKKTKKFVSILLALVLTVSSFSILSAVTASAVTDTKIYIEIPDFWGEVKWNSKHTQAAVYCHLYRIYGGSPLKETTFATKHERCTWEHDNVYSFDTTALGTIEEGALYGVRFVSDNTNGERNQTCDMAMAIQCLGDTMIVKNNPYLAPSDDVHDYIGEWSDPDNRQFGPLTESNPSDKMSVYFEVPKNWGEVVNVYCHLYNVYGGSPLEETTFASKKERCIRKYDSNVYSFNTLSLGEIEPNADYGVVFVADCIKDGETIRYQICDMTMGIQCIGDTVKVTDETHSSGAADSTMRQYIGEWSSPFNQELFGEKSYIDVLGNITPGKLPLNMPKAKHIADRLYDSAFNDITSKYFTTERLNELEAELGVTARDVYVEYVIDYGKLVDELISNPPDGYYLKPTLQNVAERLGIAIPVLGDVDGDGEASINDVTEIQMYLAKLCELSFTQTTLADVDGDGQVSINDATCIQLYCASLIGSGKTNAEFV
ncbi:MAG: dockerin type I repeat-containing protein [Ruminococcus sp.]|nr:dockerin type I repeat-containing protein [Ruminococcus sp.]